MYVKGGDYTLDRLPEARIVQSYGGEVVIVPLIEGKSTTAIVRKVARANAPQALRTSQERPDVSMEVLPVGPGAPVY